LTIEPASLYIGATGRFEANLFLPGNGIMMNRKEDWRDILSAYNLALKANKLVVGFWCLLVALIVAVACTYVYGKATAWGLVANPASSVVGLGDVSGHEGTSLLVMLVLGKFVTAIQAFLPLLNPMYTGGGGASLGHFVLSVLTYIALFWAISGPGGIIARLTALEYAKEDFPTLGDARAMVRSRRMDYFLTLVWPFMFVAVPCLLNALIGLFCSIPYVGRIAQIPLYPVAVLFGVVTWMFAIGWLLSFGLMMPAISVGGKDAFDGWSTSYAYVLWQFGRYVCYTVVAAVIGLISAIAAYWLVEFLIHLVVQSINIGVVADAPWVHFKMGGALVTLKPADGALAAGVSRIIALFVTAMRLLPAAYVVSYFFTANTLIFFLLRKSVDNIDVQEIYEEQEPTPEGETPEDVASEAYEPPAAETPEPEEEEEEEEEETVLDEDQLPEGEPAEPEDEEGESDDEEKEE